MKNSRNVKSVFLVLLLSYIVVFTVPLMSNTFFYSRTYYTIKGYLYKYNSAVLNQVKNKIEEEILRTIENIKKLVNASPFYVDFIFPSENITKTDIYLDYKAFSRELMTYYSNPFILEVCIYIPSVDKIVSANFFESSKLYYEYINKPANFTYSKWLSFLKGTYNNVFIPSFKIELNKKERNSLLFVHTLENWKLGNQNANLFIYLDEEKLREFLRELLLDQKGSIIVTDPGGRPILQYCEDKNREKKFVEVSQKNICKVGFVNVDVNKKNYILYTTTSLSNNWHYYYYIPSDSFLLNLRRIRVSIVFMIFFTIFLGGVFIYLLSLKNYKPIKDIKNMLLSYSSEKDEKNVTDEYSLLKELVGKLIKQDSSLKKQLLKFEDILKNIYAVQFLKGEGSDADELKKYFSHKIGSKSYYALVLIEIEEYFKHREEKTDEDLTQLILFNILSELFENEHWLTYTVVFTKKEIGLILATVQSDGLECERIKSILERGQNFIQSNFLVFFTAGISDVKTNIDLLPECYKEAKEALKFKYISGGRKIYSFKEVRKNITEEKSIYVPIEFENVIINSVTAGDVESTKQVIKKLFSEYLSCLPYQGHIQKLFLMQVLMIFLKILHMTGLKNNLNVSSLFKYIDEFEPDEIQKNEEILEQVKDQFVLLAKHVKEVNNKFNVSLVSKILKFIEEKYCDPNLSLTLIAEEFNITPQYLSTLFKEKVGTNLSDYIFQLRLSKAKELLVNTNMSVNEICQKIGYTHVSSFIKAFKKNEGISPAKYRSIYKKIQ